MNTPPPALHHARLTAAEHLLTATLPKLRGTFTRLQQAQPGYPAGSSGRSSEGDHSDRTGNQAARHLDKGPDPATRDLTDLHAACTRIAADIVTIADITRRWPTRPNPEWAKALRTEAARDLDTLADRWCTSCLRVGTCSVRRNDSGRLCRRCQDYARDIDADMPPVWLVDKFNRGGRINTIDIAKARREVRQAKRKKPKR